MKVTIYGAGYVGLVTAVCLAEFGYDICCLDINAEKIAMLQSGYTPIYEEGLEVLLKKALQAKKIHFTQDPKEAISYGTIQIIAVGTPPLTNGAVDLSAVLAVAKTIGQEITRYCVIVNKSTVPVGTVDRVRSVIESEVKKRHLAIDFDVVSNPEFLKEGQAVNDFMNPNRIIVGSDSQQAIRLMRELYAPLIDCEQRFLVMNSRSAELTKYAANAFLATKISFMNEMSQLAERLGADVHDVKTGLGMDVRISNQFLNPGCGFGGSCFPKDVSALKVIAEEVGYEPNILNAVIKTNQLQKRLLFEKISNYFHGDLEGKVVALWGLAFKPNTDDIRSASSRALMELLFASGAKVNAYDPLAMNNIRRIYGEHQQLMLCDSAEQALVDADVLAVVTEWRDFLAPDFKRIRQLLRCPAIFDGRNLYHPEIVISHGIEYYGIGRGISLMEQKLLETA